MPVFSLIMIATSKYAKIDIQIIAKPKDIKYGPILGNINNSVIEPVQGHSGKSFAD